MSSIIDYLDIGDETGEFPDLSLFTAIFSLGKDTCLDIFPYYEEA